LEEVIAPINTVLEGIAIAESIIVTDPFKEMKLRVKYLCRHSKFQEAKDIIEKYVLDMQGDEGIE